MSLQPISLRTTSIINDTPLPISQPASLLTSEQLLTQLVHYPIPLQTVCSPSLALFETHPVTFRSQVFAKAFHQAKACILNGEYDKANQIICSTLLTMSTPTAEKEDPQTITYFRQMQAISDLLLGNVSTAAEVFDFIATSPSSDKLILWALALRARCLLRAPIPNLEEALNSSLDALLLCQDPLILTELHINMILIRTYQKNNEEASRHLIEARRIMPDHPMLPSLNLLFTSKPDLFTSASSSGVFSSMTQVEEEDEEEETTIPDYHEALRDLINAPVDLEWLSFPSLPENLDQAIAELKAIASDSNEKSKRYEAMALLGRFYLRASPPLLEAAWNITQEAWASILSPRSAPLLAELQINRILIYVSCGRWHKAQHALTDLWRIVPTHPMAEALHALTDRDEW